MNDHHSHSNTVRNLKLAHIKAPAGEDSIRSTTTHTLKSPHPGYLVAVTFSEMQNQPNLMRIRSTNWSAEHEPYGIVTKANARAIYRRLLRAGFIPA